MDEELYRKLDEDGGKKMIFKMHGLELMRVVYRQLIITIFRMPIYPMLNKANDPEYWLLIGRESGQVSHEY